MAGYRYRSSCVAECHPSCQNRCWIYVLERPRGTMKMTVHQLREAFASLHGAWPALDEARSIRERYIASAINAGIVMLQVYGSGPNDFRLREFGGSDPAHVAAFVTAVRQKALSIALGNYRLVCRLIEHDDFGDRAFRNEVVCEVALLVEQAAEIGQMVSKITIK